MKSKKYIQSFIIAVVTAVATLASTGCTQNNGDIGDWFGEWHLRSIEINGAADNGYSGDMLWKFQNNIVEMIVVSGHTHTGHYGTWSEADGKLILNFTHSDNLHEAGTGKYAPPAQTHLPAAVVALNIVKLSSSEIILKYEAESGDMIIYTLRKRG